jgi:hypothetical protein
MQHCGSGGERHSEHTFICMLNSSHSQRAQRVVLIGRSRALLGLSATDFSKENILMGCKRSALTSAISAVR